MKLNRNSLMLMGGLAALFLLLAVLPLFLDDFLLTICIFIGINVIIVFGLSLLLGYAGQISLGHAGLYGLGAYTSAILSTKLHLNPFLTIIAGAILAGLAAYIIGLPALRLRGHYLAMATLGAGIIIQIFLVELIGLTGGPAGISMIPPFNAGKFVFDTNTSFYYLVLAAVLLSLILSLNLVRSQKGRALRAMHQNEIAAASIGINIERQKMIIFTLSGVFAGLAGGLYAHYVTYISPDTFGIALSISLVIMVVIGGSENLLAAALGAVLVTAISEYFRQYQDWSLFFFGATLVLVMIFAPRGLFVELVMLGKRLTRNLVKRDEPA
ncbi:MAG: branched-chain amino acid ABC transporter permease [Actinomycetota bacterium]